ncbi:MAG: hypothetical protein COB53_04535 [Elusimicrobia bacterium]|nr:MAG: hypothetical protein COB53_04535 [Elusimicrobiota bacterium]
MSFLNPSLLWWLPAAAAPIVLHLIFMRRARRMAFGDLTLLRAAYARSLPATRLRQWLLLALRCLLLLLLILAFARPVVHRRASAAGGVEKGIEVVVLLDTSWSMHARVRGKPRFAAAAAAAERLLGLLKPSDRTAVAAFSDGLESELAWADSPAISRAALQRIRAGYKPSNIAPALERAYRLFAESDEEDNESRKVIVVVTDASRNVLAGLPGKGLEALSGYDSEVVVLGLVVEGAPENASIFDVRPAPIVENRIGVSVRAARFGGQPRPMPLDLFVRERRVDQRTATGAEGPGRPLLFRLPESRALDHWGRFSLREDALALDDSYHFALRMRPRPKALLLYGNSRYLEAGRGGYFMKKLLSDGDRLPFSLDVADLGRFRGIDLSVYGVVLLADFRSLPEGMAERLERFVLRGGGLFVLAGTRADAKTYRDLRRVLPARIGNPIVVSENARRLRLANPPQDESVLAQRFRWDEFELQNAVVERAYPLETREDATIWFKDGEGRPLMAAGSFGQGRVLVWGSSLDIAWSNLALKPVFTAWTDVGLRWLTRYSGREQWRTLHVGESIKRVWGGGEQAPTKVQIRAPGGRRSTLLVRDRGIVFSDTREPGFYFLTPVTGEGDVRPEVFAVNVDRTSGEGNLAPSPRSIFHGRIHPETLREDFLRSVYGREARTAALGLALVLLLLEMFLARPRRIPE